MLLITWWGISKWLYFLQECLLNECKKKKRKEKNQTKQRIGQRGKTKQIA